MYCCLFWMSDIMQKYEDMDRKRKQLLALEYPYKSDRQLFDSSVGGSKYESQKSFNSLEDIREFKEMAAEDDISLIKRRDYVTGEKRTTNSQTISILDDVMSPFGEDVYRNALEKAEQEMDPIQLMKELALLQGKRLQLGVQYELDVGLGNNPETEACRQGMESILKSLHDMMYGRKYDIHADHSFSLAEEAMNIDVDDDYIDIDVGDVDEYED